MFTGVFTSIQVTTGVSDDLLQGKSNGKKAANDFATNRFSSNPTLYYFDTLKKATVKSIRI